MTHNLFIRTESLSDGSKVYDVRLGDLTFPAITEADAIALADKLAAAIREHSNDDIHRWRA